MSKAKIPNPKVPRPLDDILSEYHQLAAQAVNAQYQAFVYRKQLKDLNERMMVVSEEGDKRKQLDADNAAKAAESSDQTKSGAV